MSHLPASTLLTTEAHCLAELLFDAELDEQQHAYVQSIHLSCSRASAGSGGLGADPAVVGWANAPARHGSATMRRQRAGRAVLVVEDAPVHQAVAVRLVENCGFDAQVTGDGREALKLLCERSYAAVLMGCPGPGLDCYETARAIRCEQRGSRIPIVATTFAATPGERERCLAAGMNDHLPRPLRNRRVAEALEHWVAEPPSSELLHEAVVAELEDLGSGVLAGLLGLYFGEAPQRLQEISQAIGDDDISTVCRIAHKLRGSSCALGAARVTAVLSELEGRATAGDLPGAGDMIDELRDIVAETRQAFGQRRPDTADAERECDGRPPRRYVAPRSALRR